jgi:predicted Zn-dependent protease
VLNFIKAVFYYSLINLLFFINIAKADRIIRDAEMESVISEIIKPIVEYAKLPSDKMKIRIIENDQINAFTTFGLEIYIYTGLLTKDITPATIAGVLSHEIGHIVGGHLYKLSQNNQELFAETLGFILLSGVASYAARSSDAFVGAGALAVQLAERRALRFSRVQEYQADNFALSALQSSKYPLSGFVNFFKTMRNQESSIGLNAYASTHPTGQDRIDNINRVITSHHLINNFFFSRELQAKYRKAIIKFKAYLNKEESLIDQLAPNMNTEEKLYAHTIFYHTNGQLTKALDNIRLLIKDYPNNPFYHELQGQILYDKGLINEAVQELRLAQNLLPQNSLINIELALYEIQLASEKNAQNKESLLNSAISRLKFVSVQENDNTVIFRLLGKAYGEKGNHPTANFYFAKEAFMNGEYKKAILFATRSIQGLDKDSPLYWECESILEEAKQKNRL